jgi:metal-responsive CopG/Arc/MetJ family transcriptional regulator
MKENLIKHIQIVISEEENLLFEALRTKANNKSRSDFGRTILKEYINKNYSPKNEEKQT